MSVPRGQHQCVTKAVVDTSVAAATGGTTMSLTVHSLLIFNKELRRRNAHHTCMPKGMGPGSLPPERKAYSYTKEGIIWKELCALPPVAVPRAGAW